MRRWREWWWAVLFALMVVFAPAGARGATRTYALVIGNNAVFPDDEENVRSRGLSPLRYADDDAAAVSAFLAETSASVELLTVMDATTQGLYPEWVATARPPTLAAVQEAVHRIALSLEADRARGDQSVVWVFFSGHGTVSYRGAPGLALLDGAMSRDFLYRDVLARLHASHLHLLVDACHAESVVRPRDAQAEAVEVTPAAAAAVLLRSTLAQFPRVGAILGSSEGAQTHEWDAIGHGVFTHELLSALRGAADVNGDRMVEYSEVYAFMSAANRSIKDSRARLTILARAPESNRRVPLVDLSGPPSGRGTWLTEIPGRFGKVQVVDELGRYVATLHNEEDLRGSLLLPAGKALFVTADRREAQLSGRPGAVTRFEDLRFAPAPLRQRGRVSSSLERGLFATAYGRGYYAGFIDNAPDFVPVPLKSAAEPDRSGADAATEASSDGPALRLGAGIGLSGAVANGLGASHGLQIALARAAGSGPAVALEAFEAQDGPIHEWRAAAKVGWLWQTSPRLAKLYGGLRVGGGFVVQEVEAGGVGASALGLAGAAIGLATRIDGNVGAYAEVELSGHLLRRDGKTRVSGVPSGTLGATLAF
jgi:hypothetical protein